MRNLTQNNVFCHSLPFLRKYLEDLVMKLPKGTDFWKLYLLPKVEIIRPWEFISVSQDDHSAMFCATPGFWEAKATGFWGFSPFTGIAGPRGHKRNENGRNTPLGPPLPGNDQMEKSRLQQGPVVRISSAEETTVVDSGLKLAKLGLQQLFPDVMRWWAEAFLIPLKEGRTESDLCCPTNRVQGRQGFWFS